ncbi:hypothetical protein AtubIFM55763_003383 [Aspergillus tubingensis]|nr:hypothetical protein AtubIFM54640_004871 [Aspergillus tubingensis]GLA68314.1 hypothetical protein AtubIFM55763_003383 [Aspergillus tubingensis]GLA96948.1 hypothetical protein AtubIFM57143_004431 [Aspergillus tubingensis]GLB19117.1 hypothetical protein AtubIFM61612_009020 [Aspergillus tubingensis]
MAVYDWLATVHEITLDIIEFDGLTHSLPPSLMADPRTNTSNVLCFLDVPAPSPNWSHKDRQKHYYTLSWYITQRVLALAQPGNWSLATWNYSDRPTNNDTVSFARESRQSEDSTLSIRPGGLVGNPKPTL